MNSKSNPNLKLPSAANGGPAPRNFSIDNYNKLMIERDFSATNGGPEQNLSKISGNKNKLTNFRSKINENTLKYFINSNINKNSLNKIITLKDDNNQGLICGHGQTLKDEVCLIPDNLALFFATNKGTPLMANDINYGILKNINTRKKYVNQKTQ